MSLLPLNAALLKALLLIGFCILQFLWQGALIAAIWRVSIRVLRHHSANARYVLGIAALLAMVACPAITVVRSFDTFDGYVAEMTRDAEAAPVEGKVSAARQPAPHEAAPLPASAEFVRSSVAALTALMTQQLKPPGDTAPLGVKPSLAHQIDAAVEHVRAWLPWIAGVWIAGVLLLTGLHIGGFMRVRQLCREYVEPCSEELAELLDRLKERLHIRREVRLVESLRVAGPAMVGWLKPVILLPPCSVTGLTPDELTAILLHELAHIRRHDYLWNIIQTGAETLLFFHPAVWWISADVRREREHCCDDLVLATEGEPIVYATALMRLEELAQARRMALAATDGPLLARIKRIVAAKKRPVRSTRSHGPALLGTPLLALLIGWFAFHPLNEKAEAIPVEPPITTTINAATAASTFEPNAFVKIKDPAMELHATNKGVSVRNVQLPIPESVVRQILNDVRVDTFSFSVFDKATPNSEVIDRSGSAQAFESLREEGMMPVLRVPATNIDIYARTDGQLIQNLVGVVENEKNVVTFRISGEIDPGELGRQIGSFAEQYGRMMHNSTQTD